MFFSMRGKDAMAGKMLKCLPERARSLIVNDSATAGCALCHLPNGMSRPSYKELVALVTCKILSVQVRVER